MTAAKREKKGADESAAPAAAAWLSVEEARAAILSSVREIAGEEEVPVADALLRVTARDITAPFDVPGHDNSAMDGFACRLADVAGGERTLRIAGESFAGHPYGGGFAAGECVKIMTGARLPAETEIVVPQEETRAEEGAVTILPAKNRRAGLNTRRRGEDLRAGKTALAKGALCFPAQLGLLTSLGMERVAVKRRLRAAFFSTGDEVRTAGEALGDGDVYDSNRATLRAMIGRMGFEALDFGVVRDDRRALADALDAAAAAADVVISSGGASVGEADYIRAVLAERGETRFWKVAMRPGRPLAYGKVGGADFFGLPGNPVSVMVCFYQFARAALWKRAGRAGDLSPPEFAAVAATALRKSPGRTEYQRGTLSRRSDGAWQVAPTGDQGSGILSSMTRADCFIVLPAESGPVCAGETVMVQPFEGIV